ncbi:hypothetical protein P4K67_22035 [Bacillus cereus]|nr:hypothetical protein [Bacillus cereus]
MREIFEILKKLCDSSGRHHLNIVKEISEQISISKDFSVKDIIKKNINSALEDIAGSGYITLENVYSVTSYSVFSLIKHIMISEDMTYNRDGYLGRYLFQLAIYDYIVKEVGLDEVLQKYGLDN